MNASAPATHNNKMAKRFDGYLPVVVDVETSGVNPKKNALLELAAVLVEFNEQGQLVPGAHFTTHVIPFKNAEIEPEALAINGIDPYHPFRFAIKEEEALDQLFEFTKDALEKQRCRRALLVGHNAQFDLSFLQAAMRRSRIDNGPYHAFTCIDTAGLSGVVYGKTILAKALKKAKIEFDKRKAHSALYDAEKTAELFCQVVNWVDGVK